MNFQYKLSVEGWGYTYCANGLELDRVIRQELAEIDSTRITITIEKMEPRAFIPNGLFDEDEVDKLTE